MPAPDGPTSATVPRDVETQLDVEGAKRKAEARNESVHVEATFRANKSTTLMSISARLRRAGGRARRGRGNLNSRAEISLALAEVQRAARRADEADASVAEALALYEQKGNIAAAARARAALSESATLTWLRLRGALFPGGVAGPERALTLIEAFRLSSVSS